MEYVLTDLSDRVINGQLIQLYISEHTVCDLGYGCGNSILTALTLREEQDLGLRLVKYNAVLTGEIFTVRGNVYLLKRSTTVEDTGDLRYVCRKRNSGQLLTVVEYVFTKLQGLAACSKGQRLKTRAVRKSRCLDQRNGCGDLKGNDVLTAHECALTNGGYAAACLKSNGSQLFASAERILVNDHIIERVACEGQSGQLFGKSVECALTDQGYGVGNRDLGQTVASDERTGSYRLRSYGNCQHATLGCGTVDQGLAVCGIQNAVNRLEILVAGYNGNRGQRGAANECVINVVNKHFCAGNRVLRQNDVGHACGKNDLLQHRAAAECACADRQCRLTRCGFKENRGQLCAVSKCFSADLGYTGGNRDLGERAVCKCLSRNFGNACGDAVATGFCQRHKQQLGLCYGAGTVIKENAVLRPVARVGALGGAINVYSLQIGASVEGINVGDLLQRVGKIDHLEVGAILECVTRKHCNGQTLVGGGNGYFTQQCDSLTCRYCVSILAVYLGEGELQSRVDPERVNVRALGSGPRRNACTLAVGILRTHSVRSAVPAAKYAGDFVGSGNGQLIVVFECNFIGGLITGSVGAVMIVYGVLVGIVVCIKHQCAGLSKQLIGISHTVASRSAGYVVPCVKAISDLFGYGQIDQVANSLVLNADLATAAGIEGHCMCKDLKLYPLGAAVAVHAANADHVLACAGQRDLCRGCTVCNSNDRTVVHTQLVSRCADHGIPGQNALCVSQGVAHYVVTCGNGITPQRFAVADRANAYGILGALYPVHQGCHIKGSFGYLTLLVANLYLILGSTCYSSPSQGRAVEANVGRRCGSRLGYLQFNSVGRIVAVGLGVNLYHDTAIKRCALLQADRGLASVIEEGMRVCGIAAGYGYHIGSSVCHFIPNNGLCCCIVAESGNGRKLSAVNKFLGYGGRIALSNCGNGEADTALGHCAVCEVEGSGCAVIKIGVLMIGVAANNGNQIFFSMLNRVEYQHGIDHLEYRYLAKCLVGIVTNSLGVICITGVCICNNGDLISALCVGCKRNVERGAGNGFVDYGSTVGSNYLNSVGSCAVYSIPANGAGFHVYNGSRQLGAAYGSFPQCVQRGVRIKYHFILELVRKLGAVVVHTDPPTLEGVAFSGGNGQIEQLAANSRLCFQSSCVFVIQIKVNRILNFVCRCGAPTSVNGNVIENGLCSECEGRFERAVCIPAYEQEPFTGRIGRLCNGLSVQNGLRLDCATAVCLKGNRVVYLLEHAVCRAVVGQGDHVVCQGGSDGFFPLGCKVERQIAICEGVETGIAIAFYDQGKRTVGIQRQRILVNPCVKVIHTRLGMLRLRGRNVRVVGVFFTTLNSQNDNQCKHQRKRYGRPNDRKKLLLLGSHKVIPPLNFHRLCG